MTGGVVQEWTQVQKRLRELMLKSKNCFETDRLEEALLTDFYMCAQVLLLKEQTRRSCWLIWRRSWSRADS